MFLCSKIVDKILKGSYSLSVCVCVCACVCVCVDVNSDFSHLST